VRASYRGVVKKQSMRTQQTKGTTIKNQNNNIGRCFTPTPEIADELRFDGLKPYRRCCEIQGYGDGRMYFTHVDGGEGDVADLYWANDDAAMIDL